jgi:glycosidase
LQFFEKDPIEWRDRPLQTFYRTLLRLHKTHPALAQGVGSEFAFQAVGNDQVVAFSRRASAAEPRKARSVMQLDVAVNLSGQAQTWRDPHGQTRRLGPWGFWWRGDDTRG